MIIVSPKPNISILILKILIRGSCCTELSQALIWKPHSNGWVGHLKMPGKNEDDLLDHDLNYKSCCSKQFGSICLCSGGRAEGWPSENKLMRVKQS